MITITTVWLCLITDVVYGTIITVNNNGNDNVGMEHVIVILSHLLLHNMLDNTLINIKSELVTPHDIVGIRSGNLPSLV